jgi:hypothetical protein
MNRSNLSFGNITSIVIQILFWLVIIDIINSLLVGYTMNERLNLYILVIIVYFGLMYLS